MLYAAGLVAGGSLVGVLIAGLQGYPRLPSRQLGHRDLNAVNVHGWERLGIGADIIGVGMFAVLCFFLVRAARQKLEVQGRSKRPSGVPAAVLAFRRRTMQSMRRVALLVSGAAQDHARGARPTPRGRAGASGRSGGSSQVLRHELGPERTGAQDLVEATGLEAAERAKVHRDGDSMRRFLRGPTLSPERSSCPVVRGTWAPWPPGRRARSSIGPVRWRSRSVAAGDRLPRDPPRPGKPARAGVCRGHVLPPMPAFSD